MADKKIEKALYGPSTFEVVLGAILGFILGIFLACVYLVFKPVQTVKEMPKPEERKTGVVYYLPGNTSGGSARDWAAKQQTFIRGGQVILTEAELNTWATASLNKAPATPPGGKAGAAPADQGGMLTASGVNFRVADSKLHVNAKVTLNYFGVKKDVQMQSKGDLARSGNTFVYAPEEVYLGSCPLHKLPPSGSMLVSALFKAQRVPDDVRAAWAKVAEADVDGALVKVTTTP
jgi:hypothetical protein